MNLLGTPMCWHKWTKWEQKTIDYSVVINKVSYPATKLIQQQYCLKCNYMKQKEVDAY